jgi:hypothetical protein
MTDSRSRLVEDPTRLRQARRAGLIGDPAWLRQARRPRRSLPVSRRAIHMALLAALAGAAAAVIVMIVLAHVLQVAVR